MDNEKIVSKIRKLLALGQNSAASEGERENAMRQAHAMLAKHNLDMASVEQSGGSVDGEPRERAMDMFYGRPWARSVCRSIGELFFCSYVYTANTDALQIRHHFIGRRSNAVTAMEISRWLVESIRREAKREARHLGQGNAYVRSFCTGASIRIADRVRRMIEEATKPQQAAASTGTSLVLANHYQLEEQKNEEMKMQIFPNLKTGTRGKIDFSTTALMRGHEYGDKVSLNRQIGSKQDFPKLK